jgi:ribosomal protein S18 acetylase RimI-like enzyme
VLVNLAIRSAYRNRAIGATLLKTLLASQPCPRAFLSTEVANAGAGGLYERNGWRYLHPGLVFTPGQQPFVVMGCEVNSGV